MRISAEVILFSIIGITLFFVAIAVWFFSYIGFTRITLHRLERCTDFL